MSGLIGTAPLSLTQIFCLGMLQISGCTATGRLYTLSEFVLIKV